MEGLIYLKHDEDVKWLLDNTRPTYDLHAVTFHPNYDVQLLLYILDEQNVLFLIFQKLP